MFPGCCLILVNLQLLCKLICQLDMYFQYGDGTFLFCAEVVDLVLVGRLYLSMGTSGLDWIFLNRCLVCSEAFLPVKLSSLYLKMSWYNNLIWAPFIRHCFGAKCRRRPVACGHGSGTYFWLLSDFIN